MSSTPHWLGLHDLALRGSNSSIFSLLQYITSTPIVQAFSPPRYTIPFKVHSDLPKSVGVCLPFETQNSLRAVQPDWTLEAQHRMVLGKQGLKSVFPFSFQTMFAGGAQPSAELRP